MAIDRDAIRPMALPREEVEAPEIGGSVTVQGMNMPQLLEFTSARRRLQAPRPGETEEQAVQRASGELLTLVLGMCVLAADGMPVYSPAEWGAFGALYPERAVALWDTAIRLSGQQPEAEKKT